MADRYLLESSLIDGYLLEDASGVLLLEAIDGIGALTSAAASLSGSGVLQFSGVAALTMAAASIAATGAVGAFQPAWAMRSNALIGGVL
jgi:hypothetical protein